MDAVFDHSESTAVTRLVLLAIADSAWDDGVTYLQVESSNPKRETITTKAKCSRAQAFRAIEKLVELGELQVVRVRRGRSFVNVFRVVVGRIGAAEIDYDRLPFALPHPFDSPSHIATVPTVSSGAVQGLKSERSPSHSDTSHLSIDLEPSTDPNTVQEEHPENGGDEEQENELEALLRTTLRGVVPFIETCVTAGIDRVEFDERLPALRRRARPFTSVERRALLGRFDELRGETARQAYERWIDEKSADAGFPLDEIAATVATWDDLDDVDREELLQRAATLRAGEAAPGRKAA
jgi:hypothetical protein